MWRWVLYGWRVGREVKVWTGVWRELETGQVRPWGTHNQHTLRQQPSRTIYLTNPIQSYQTQVAHQLLQEVTWLVGLQVNIWNLLNHLCLVERSSFRCDISLQELLQVSEMTTVMQAHESLLKPSVYEKLKMVLYFSSQSSRQQLPLERSPIRI